MFAGYFTFRVAVALFSIIPFPVLYFFSDGLFYLFFYVIEYRKKVVLENLKKSFPEKSESEILQISRDFYKHFCDILLEGIKGLSMTKEELLKRYIIINPELINSYFDKNTSIIAVAAHYANWEWGVLSSSLQVKSKCFGLYMPLSNTYIDRYIKRSRANWGMNLVSVKETYQCFEENKNIPSVYIFVTDQSPSNKEKAVWVNFLNQHTAFLHGVEKYSQQASYPIVYTDVKKRRRGYYEVEFSVLCENPVSTKQGEITIDFAKKLETIILSKPELWLWSHKRWKLKAG
jgi:KDO2-lipid IV(A) lauroyltransferase